MNIYGVIRKCLLEGRNSQKFLNELLDLNTDIDHNKPFEIEPKPRANSLR